MSLQGSAGGFFRELRRRKVVRVIIVYVAVAWTMVEVSKTGAEVLQLPTWTPRLVLMMFLLGFPLAVLLAWAYELTPEGLRRTDSDADAGAAVQARSVAGPALATGRTVPSRKPQLRRAATAPPPQEPRRVGPPDAAQLRRATLASLRHELRTPLGAVIGYSEMLLEDATPEQAPPLREILDSGHQVFGLVDELLRPGTGDLSDDSVAEMRRRIRAELPAPVDRLVASARGGLDRARTAGHSVLVPDLERITEAAERLKGLVETDLLELERELAAAGDRDSTHDVAVRVITSLPSRGFGTADSALPKHGQILVVDDNEDNRDLLSRQLARQGFSVSLASNGEEALQALRGQDFDLVLLDVLMPGLDGIEVLGRMQQDVSMSEVPVIMTSALDEIDGVVRCIEQGAVDYLTKPFNPVLMQARVRATLDLHRLRSQQRRVRQELDEEMVWSGRLIRSLVPEPLMERVREGRGTLVENHESVTVLAMTIHGVGTYAARQGAPALGSWMSEAVNAFDAIAAALPVEAHWEGGTTLIASTGTVAARGEQSAAIAELALRLAAEAAASCAGVEPIHVGIGIHTGPAIAGLIEAERVAFGLWGEGPDVAREMAWQSADGAAHASPAAYAALHDSFAFEAREVIETSAGRHRIYGLVGRREMSAAQ